MTSFIRRDLYWVLLAWDLAWVAWGLATGSFQLANAIAGGTMVATLLVLEWRFPLERRWRMTKRHLLRRDIWFIGVNGLVIAALNFGLVGLSIAVAAPIEGYLTGKPIVVQVVTGLLVFELLQYTIHRFMHLDGNAVLKFLWRSHAIHHLPQQLYVVMHAVFHPFNAIVVRLAVQLTPLWILGYDPTAVFIMGSIIGLHGTISHLNLDLRMGFMNYVFVGPELHRYHHSAVSAEAVNYGATLSIFDQLLGTFRYTPGRDPASLGLDARDGYPGQHQPLDAFAFPFGRTGYHLADDAG